MYEDLERQKRVAQKALEDPGAKRCPKCGNGYFELVQYSQYKDNHVIILGQRPPALSAASTFYALRCICGELLEPLVNRPANNIVSKKYDQFLDAMEAAYNKEKK